MKGRKPVPREMKILHGTFRKDRDKGIKSLSALTEIPRPPTWLGKYGKKIWKELGQKLVEDKILTEIDLYSFEMLCGTYQMFAEARDAVFRPLDPATGKRRKQTLQEYMKGRNSQTQPEYIAYKSSYQLFKQYLTEFGISPSSRSRVEIPGPGSEETDPIEEMWNERR